MNNSFGYSKLKRIKDPKNRALLINYVLKDTNVFKEPLVSILIGLQGLFEVVVALIILGNSLLHNPLNTQSEETLENDIHQSFYTIKNILQDYQVILQPLILGLSILFGALPIFDLTLGTEKKNGLLRVLVRYFIAVLALLVFTLFQPVMIALVVSAFFTLEKDGIQVEFYTIQITLATLNSILLLMIGIFGKQIYTREIFFINNALAQDQSYLPLVTISHKIILMVTIFASTAIYDSNRYDNNFAQTLIPVCAALGFLEVILKVVKMQILKISKIVSIGFTILVSCIMFMAFAYSGIFIKEYKSFLILILYSVLQSLFFTIGFYFMFLYYSNKKLHMLYGKIVLDEQQLVDGLNICFVMLKKLIDQGPNAKNLLGLLSLLNHHTISCKDVQCICRHKKSYLKEIHKIQLNEMESAQLLENPAFSSDSYQKMVTYEDRKKYFLIEFMMNFMLTLTKKALKQYPSSLELASIGLNIILAFPSNNSKMIAQFLIINLNSKQYKSSEKLRYMQLIYLIEEAFETKSQDNSLINPDNLIKNHKLQKVLKEALSDLSEETLRFWSYFKTQQLIVKHVAKSQNQYSSTIIKVQQLFSQLEMSNQDKLYTLYIQSLMHRLIFNDSVSGFSYLKKLQQFCELNKLFNRQQNQMDSVEASFMIVDAQLGSLGKILAANQNISIMLNYGINELEKSVKIEQLMPKDIKQQHFQLIKEMMQTGNGGKKFASEGSNVFVLKKSGFFIPMNLKVQLIKTVEYDLVYLAKFDKLKAIKIDELSLSNSVIQTSQYDTKNEFLSLYDLIDDTHTPSLEEFENQKIDQLILSDVWIDREVIKRLTHSAISKANLNQENKIPCTIYIQRQTIYKDRRSPYKMPVYQIVVYVLIGQIQHTIVAQTKERSQYYQQQIDLKNMNDQAQQQMVLMDEDNSSQDSTHTNSSNLNESPENIKQYLNQGIEGKQSSKSLSIVFKLVGFLFFVMVCIGMINLGLTLQRHNTQNQEIQVVKLSFDRLNYHAKVRVLLRNLINMANDYEPDSSTYESDRYTQIKNMLKEKLLQIKSVQDYLDGVVNQHLYSFEMPVRMVQVQTLADDNSITSNQQTYSVAYHLYISNTLVLLDKKFSAFIGKSNVQLIIPDYSKPPTNNEQLVSFCALNSMGDIVLRNWQEAQDYTAQSKQHSIDAKNNNLLTTLVSVVTIFIVGCVITPMIAQFYKRRYESLKYFLIIDLTQLLTVLNNCEEFNQQIEDDIRAVKVIKNRMRRGGAVANSQNAIRDVSSNSSQYDDDDQNQQIQSSIQYSSLNEQIGSYQSVVSYRLTDNQSNQISVQEDNQSIVSQLAGDRQKKMSSIIKAPIVQNIISVTESIAEQKSQQNFSLVSQLKSNQSLVSIQDNDQNANSPNKQKENQEESKDDEQIAKQKIFAQIRIAQRDIQVTAFLVIGIIISVFALYFVGTFILALKAFNNAPEILNNLQMIFSKDACIENAIAYIRDNEIINSTTYIDPIMTGTGQPEIGSTFTLDQCMQLEDQYRKLRKDLPEYFKKSEGLIEAIEISQCDAVSINGLTQEECVESFDGLLKVGYSQAVAVVLSKFKQIDLQYFSNKNYSLQWITDIVQDIQQINLMEANEFYIFEVAGALKQSVVNSTLHYFEKLKRSYLIIFCIFILVMIFLLIVFLIDTHKRMRYQSLLTNQSFRILPLEFLNKEDLSSLKQFCQS